MYLCDLWKIAPKRVAFAHTVLALIPLFIGPFLLKKPCLYPALALEQKEQIQHKLMFSKWYLLRLVAYGLRGHALVATLRDEKVRTKILQDSPLTQRGSHGADYKRSLG